MIKNNNLYEIYENMNNNKTFLIKENSKDKICNIYGMSITKFKPFVTGCNYKNRNYSAKSVQSKSKLPDVAINNKFIGYCQFPRFKQSKLSNLSLSNNNIIAMKKLTCLVNKIYNRKKQQPSLFVKNYLYKSNDKVAKSVTILKNLLYKKLHNVYKDINYKKSNKYKNLEKDIKRSLKILSNCLLLEKDILNKNMSFNKTKSMIKYNKACLSENIILDVYNMNLNNNNKNNSKLASSVNNINIDKHSHLKSNISNDSKHNQSEMIQKDFIKLSNKDINEHSNISILNNNSKYTNSNFNITSHSFSDFFKTKNIFNSKIDMSIKDMSILNKKNNLYVDNLLENSVSSDNFKIDKNNTNTNFYSRQNESNMSTAYNTCIKFKDNISYACSSLKNAQYEKDIFFGNKKKTLIENKISHIFSKPLDIKYEKDAYYKEKQLIKKVNPIYMDLEKNRNDLDIKFLNKKLKNKFIK